MAKMIQSKTRAARKCRARQWCSSSDDNESQFKVMVIHDDMRSGVGAQNALDAVARQIGQGALDIRFWKHDILTHGNLWQQASADAEEANLIVFAMSTPAILPVRLMGWVNRWRQRFAMEKTAFAVLAPEECQGQQLVKLASRFLKDFAHKHHTAFFNGTIPSGWAHTCENVRDESWRGRFR